MIKRSRIFYVLFLPIRVPAFPTIYLRPRRIRNRRHSLEVPRYLMASTLMEPGPFEKAAGGYFYLEMLITVSRLAIL